LSRLLILKKLKAKHPLFSKSQLETLLDHFLEILENNLSTRKKIQIRSFGTFFTKEIKEKKSARNPKTGELIYVPKKNKLRFKPSKKLNILINEK
tara:strand:- start:840 stop:1124 length:285 start_codon:yes stop_codon:yes gene_type:complete